MKKLYRNIENKKVIDCNKINTNKENLNQKIMQNNIILRVYEMRYFGLNKSNIDYEKLGK